MVVSGLRSYNFSLIPFGNDVPNVFIQKLSFSFLCLSVHLGLWSIRVTLSLLKISAIAVPCVRRCLLRGKFGLHLVSLLCPFIRLLNRCTDSPTYWRLHIPHCKRYMMFSLLQFKLTWMSNCLPFDVLVKCWVCCM